MAKSLFYLVFLLFIILGIGIISSFFYPKTGFDWLKDFLYFLKPILAVLAGYLLSRNIKDYNYILAGIIYIACFFAIVHIVKVLYHTQFVFDSINQIRNSSGLDNFIEVLALALLIGSIKYKILRVFHKNTHRNLAVLVLFISVSLYFSRAMLVAFIILGLAVYGYLKLSDKALKYGLILAVLIGVFYTYLFSVEIERDKPGISSFLYKMKIAPSEIFSTNYKIDSGNHSNLWDHWRAYEAGMALEQMNEKPITYFAGNGFGSLVDLKFKAPLGEDSMQFIPFLHNGYIYVLLKTGVLGLMCYIFFITGLYLEMFKFRETISQKVFSNLIGGIGLFYLFSSLIITGIYNSNEIFIFILGMLFYLSNDKNLKSIE